MADDDMDDMAIQLRIVRSTVFCSAMSSQTPCTIGYINGGYKYVVSAMHFWNLNFSRDLEGRPIPYRDFGYDSLEKFLLDHPKLNSMRNEEGELVFMAQLSKETAHIQNMIARQKSKKKKKGGKRKPGMFRPVSTGINVGRGDIRKTGGNSGWGSASYQGKTVHSSWREIESFEHLQLVLTTVSSNPVSMLGHPFPMSKVVPIQRLVLCTVFSLCVDPRWIDLAVLLLLQCTCVAHSLPLPSYAFIHSHHDRMVLFRLPKKALLGSWKYSRTRRRCPISIFGFSVVSMQTATGNLSMVLNSRSNFFPIYWSTHSLTQVFRY